MRSTNEVERTVGWSSCMVRTEGIRADSEKMIIPEVVYLAGAGDGGA